jgi:putative tryptophan/tyrosine transport system substrate-binding protein
VRRRPFLCGSALVLATPLAAEAQSGRVSSRVGVLTLSVAFATPTFQGFRQGLRDLGYLESQNIVLEPRFANGSPEKLRDMATDLVRTKVDVIVTESVVAAREARNATASIPIVTAIHGDPVGAGLAASVTRPGGNVTGLSLLAPAPA